MAVGRKINAKGRNIGKQRFVMMPHWAFDCPTYRCLKPGPRALLWELIRRFNGANNGRIAFSQRDMCTFINVTDRATVASYVRELESGGFIIAQRRGGFSVKVADRRATEWTLTMWPVGEQQATKDFMHRKPKQIDGMENPTFKEGIPIPKHTADVRPRSDVRKIPSQKTQNDADAGTANPPTYTFIAIAGGTTSKNDSKTKSRLQLSSPPRAKPTPDVEVPTCVTERITPVLLRQACRRAAADEAALGRS